MKKRTRTPGYLSKAKKVNPYAGMLICGNCGYNLQRVSCRDGYDCSSYHKKGNLFCGSHFVKREILDEIVKHEIQRQAGMALKEKDKDELLKAADRRRELERRSQEAERKIKKLQEELTNIKKYKKKTYENFVDGILTKDEYISYKSEYEHREETILDRISQIEQKKEHLGEDEENYENWIEKFVKYGALSEVSREIVVELIDKIVINDDKRIDIEFKYQSPYRSE